MAYSKVLAMIMAGGRGERLFPLTFERSKPSVPFGGRYRIVDFVLSKFTDQEFEVLPKVIKTAGEAALSFCSIGIERTMNFFNN